MTKNINQRSVFSYIIYLKLGLKRNSVQYFLIFGYRITGIFSQLFHIELGISEKKTLFLARQLIVID